MTWWEAILLIGAGIFAGFINTVAGGGSLITLPLLIFMDLPSSQANATNRVAIFLQNIFSVSGFRSKGVSVFPYALWLAISGSCGAVLGAYLAVDIDSVLFNRILAVVMLLVIGLTVFKPMLSAQKVEEIFTTKRSALSIFLFFGVGIYGGFIQAGIGFLMIAILTGIHGLSMAKTNSIKVFVVLVYTSFALAVFIIGGQVQWVYGLTLAAGNSAGGWIASRWSVDKDDKVIRTILVITVLALSIKLWFFGT
ncbi:MAG: sulfite exporter TauE/SafE family protein [Cyclobacteriaceae bacterium]|nr:sulfite exporter TauE/SafE family protein [Cyclobacteriaceae bacterium HetDA_MAG_MS6]